MRTLVTATVLGLGLLTSGTAMANNNFGGSPLYNPQYSYYGTPYYYGSYPSYWNYNTGYPTYYPGYDYATATRTMGGIRGPRIPTGILRPHGILIRKPTLIGYLMSAGAEPSASAPRSELRRIGLMIEV